MEPISNDLHIHPGGVGEWNQRQCDFKEACDRGVEIPPNQGDRANNIPTTTKIIDGVTSPGSIRLATSEKPKTRLAMRRSETASIQARYPRLNVAAPRPTPTS